MLLPLKRRADNDASPRGSPRSYLSGDATSAKRLRGDLGAQFRVSTALLTPGYVLDVRDKYRKWCKGEVVSVDREAVVVHFTGWDPQWDEKISINDRGRLALCGSYTDLEGSLGAVSGQQVKIRHSTAGSERWVEGKVIKVEKAQIQVALDVNVSKKAGKPKSGGIQRWYCDFLDEIRLAGK